MPDRLITRAQNLLRAFWGLGPAQFSLDDVVHPTLDIDFLMRSPQDCQVVGAVANGVIPGGNSGIVLNPPSAGSWLLHAWSANTPGPATSGSVRVSPYIHLEGGTWGAVADIGIEPYDIVMPRVGAAITRRGRFLDRPIVLYRSRTGLVDQLVIEVFNDGASVGNANFTGYALYRPLESVLNP